MTKRYRVFECVSFLALLGAVGIQSSAEVRQQRDVALTPDSLPQTIEFNRDIRPILSDKCFKCHGPGTQMGTLRFDLEDGAKHELSGGRRAIAPGDPANSQMIVRITAANPAVRMPRSQGGAEAGDPLSQHEIDLLRRWIEQGATWQKHWSFIPPARPAVPTVKNAKWVRNPIDAFVMQRLEREGLMPSLEAERATLLRRVTLDLTGLPPTPAEVNAFLADKSSNAYEKVVDRLLQSPRYGERMAFPWLEAARYADSNGYQSDGQRFMWRWRDWVIDAFDKNTPYDQFTIEQIAGDLLPNATLDQQIATAFNRNHRGNSEGGIIPEEYAAEYIMDRVDTSGTVFLGLSIGCTKCHSHKYDPITQKEYYQLFAYFNNVPEFGRARRVGNSPPFMAAPTPDQARELKQLDDRLAAANAAYAKLQPELQRAQGEWERSLNSTSPIIWAPVRALVAHYALDGDLTAQVALFQPPPPPPPPAPVAGGQPVPAPPPAAPPSPPVVPTPQSAVLSPHEGDAQFVPGRLGQAAGFDGKRFVQGGDIAGFTSHIDDPKRTFSYDDPYTIAAWIYPTAPTGAIVTKAEDKASDAGDIEVRPDSLGLGLNLKNGRVRFNYLADIDEGIRIETQEPVTMSQWHQVTLTYDGSRWASGFKIYVDGAEWKWKALQDDINNPAPAGAKREPLRIGAGGGPANRFHGSIDDVRIYSRLLSAAEVAELSDITPVTDIAKLPEERRTLGQREKIRSYFLEYAAPPAVREARARAAEAQARRDEFYKEMPTVMVMQEMSPPRETHLLIRGQYDKPGEVVTPALPSALLTAAAAYPPNRLGFARWLVDPANPLMSRVTVNRFWQQYFGIGIVKTSEDFGSQGEAPSHPELLDWLATEFIRTGWNVKALQKTIVMSATYRQASSVPADMSERDPQNRLLARGPNIRLSAEMVRDQALALAGLLAEKVGGPSVKPYQPDGLWNEVGGGAAYIQDHGPDLYRRSLYTFWKRTVPPPTMANFDASARESCVVRPGSTNTPLQALDLMNDVTYVEAARMIAQRAMTEGGVTPPERISWTFQLATARPPKRGEADVLLDAFGYALETFKKNPGAAAKYLSVGESKRNERFEPSELAAYANVASLILNLNQTILKE